MKTFSKILIIVALFIVLSPLCGMQPDDFFSNTIYTVSGIIFSVGFGLIVTFNMSGVKNKKYLIQLRGVINQVRNSFLKYFFISTLSFIVDYYLRQKHINITVLKFYDSCIELNWSVLSGVLMIFSIVYYIVNFLEIQKLNNDILDKTT